MPGLLELGKLPVSGQIRFASGFPLAPCRLTWESEIDLVRREGFEPNRGGVEGHAVRLLPGLPDEAL